MLKAPAAPPAGASGTSRPSSRVGLPDHIGADFASAADDCDMRPDDIIMATGFGIAAPTCDRVAMVEAGWSIAGSRAPIRS